MLKFILFKKHANAPHNRLAMKRSGTEPFVSECSAGFK